MSDERLVLNKFKEDVNAHFEIIKIVLSETIRKRLLIGQMSC